jgi:hypothetical protein
MNLPRFVAYVTFALPQFKKKKGYDNEKGNVFVNVPGIHGGYDGHAGLFDHRR